MLYHVMARFTNGATLEMFSSADNDQALAVMNDYRGRLTVLSAWLEWR